MLAQVKPCRLILASRFRFPLACAFGESTPPLKEQRTKKSKDKGIKGSKGRLASCGGCPTARAQQISGFRVFSAGKRLKSRSTVQSSPTPPTRQQAAILASWIKAPRTVPLTANSPSLSKTPGVSHRIRKLGDSRQARICSIASSGADGFFHNFGCVTTP